MKKFLLKVIVIAGIIVMPLTASFAQEEVKIPEKTMKIFLKAENLYHHFAYFKAIEQYKRFLSLQKNHHESMLKIASSYYHVKDYDQTLAWYDTAVTNGELPTEHQVQY